jgi:hypothetical protein
MVRIRGRGQREGLGSFATAIRMGSGRPALAGGSGGQGGDTLEPVGRASVHHSSLKVIVALVLLQHHQLGTLAAFQLGLGLGLGLSTLAACSGGHRVELRRDLYGASVAVHAGGDVGVDQKLPAEAGRRHLLQDLHRGVGGAWALVGRGNEPEVRPRDVPQLASHP